MGGNFIDTANVYCRWLPDTENFAEQFLGEWFRRTGNRSRICPCDQGGHHQPAKPGQNRVNRADLTRELEESLTTLGVDYVDFYWTPP
jgi:aryl-alcohol dehydrogenase-like predicted oxidoreductase